MNIEDTIRIIPNYPTPGIMFRDVTTLLKNPLAFQTTIQQFSDNYSNIEFDKIIGIESRGFIFGASLAQKMNKGFVPIRKKGKLPYETLSQEYSLEYGRDIIEIHIDAISPGEKIVVIDDLIATGGTALAACQLLQKLQAEIVGFGFVINLANLGGKKLLEEQGISVFSICHYNE